MFLYILSDNHILLAPCSSYSSHTGWPFLFLVRFLLVPQVLAETMSWKKSKLSFVQLCKNVAMYHFSENSRQAEGVGFKRVSDRKETKK